MPTRYDSDGDPKALAKVHTWPATTLDASQ
jgi:hypothetical protein